MQQPTVQIATVSFVIDAPISEESHYVPLLINQINSRFVSAGLGVYSVVERVDDHCINVRALILAGSLLGNVAAGANWTIERIENYPQLKQGVIEICQDVQKLENRIPTLEPVAVFCRDMTFVGYGPVQTGDTLGAIVRKIGLHRYTEAQLMWAIVRENPRAFIDGNPDRLKAGVSLSIPTTKQILATSNADAVTRLAQGRKGFN